MTTKKTPHNKGKFKNPLGRSTDIVECFCEKCGKKFNTRVSNIYARGGGRFCSRKCHPSFAKRFTEYEKARRSNLRRYGLTTNDYEDLYSLQNGLCAICGNPQLNRKKHLSVDHDHETGIVRGLLCEKCNWALGWFGDCPSRILNAIRYLQSPPAPKFKVFNKRKVSPKRKTTNQTNERN